jgi:indole-3-glycerol phosphate synthase
VAVSSVREGASPRKESELDYSRTSPEVQALSDDWVPPGGVLGGIVAETRRRIDDLLRRRPQLEAEASRVPEAPSFRRALTGPSVAVIAEIKRRSPSRGPVNPALSAPHQAAAYASGGASAISVLTEPAHFGGSPADLVDARRVMDLPVLKKDFHLHPVQLLEARSLGASAVLLIVRALAPATLRQMIEAAGALRLDVLVEVRTLGELATATDVGAQLIGVNSRNLETLGVSPGEAEEVLRAAPGGVLAVYESGVRDRDDVERAARAGADAVLVGSAVSAAADPLAAVRALVGVRKRRDARR